MFIELNLGDDDTDTGGTDYRCAVEAPKTELSGLVAIFGN